MKAKSDRLVIDTNLWIAFLITNNYKKLDEKIRRKAVTILFSLELIEEVISVAERPKFRRYFTKHDLKELVDLFDAYGEIVDVISKVDICRDPKDNFLLALAKDSKANYLITGDQDLLDLKKFAGTEIVSMADYLTK